MFGIKNYTPMFFEDKNKFTKKHRNKLRSLIGLNIDEVWTVHDASNGLFWAESPVIIGVEGNQLEFCSFKDNEIAVTWDEIDLEEKLDWYGIQDLNLEWRKNAIENINDIIAQAIREIEIIEVMFDSKENNSFSTFLQGLGFAIEKGYLSIFNAFDETGFSYSKDGRYLYTML